MTSLDKFIEEIPNSKEFDRSELRLMGTLIMDWNGWLTLTKKHKDIYEKTIVNNKNIPRKQDNSLPDFFESGAYSIINGDPYYPISFYEKID